MLVCMHARVHALVHTLVPARVLVYLLHLVLDKPLHEYDFGCTALLRLPLPLLPPLEAPPRWQDVLLYAAQKLVPFQTAWLIQEGESDCLGPCIWSGTQVGVI